MNEIYRLSDYSYMMRQKREEKEQLLRSKDLQEKRIAVLCGSTFGEIKEFLEIYLLHYGIKPVFLIGEYNRFFEEACFSNDALKEFAPNIIFIHMTNKNLLYRFDSGDTTNQLLMEEEKRLMQMWKALEEQYHCIIIQNNFEYFSYRIIGNMARTCVDGSVKYIDDINRFLSTYVSKNKNIYLNDIHFLASYIGLRNWNDDRMWNMYKYPMGMSSMPRYALSIASIIKSVFGKNKKTIITDLDNTLWGGIIGELGAENIKLGNETPQGESFELIHRYLKYLSKHGIALNICSKNEYETGISGLRSKKSILKEEDFVIKKINWKNKHENIEDILKELNVTGDSAVFLDDNLVECDSVKGMLPSLEVLQMEKVRDFLEEMEAISFFEMTRETQEDRQRNQYYMENVERGEAKKQYQNYDDYLKALHMVCYVDSVHDTNIDRIVQLFNKTNQFNFLTKRYTLEEIKELSEKSGMKVIVLDLEDKFGSNGIVSAAIVRFEREEAFIDGWVMSCRVFERGLELVMMELICKLCLKQNICVLHGYYRETAKNKKIADFFGNMGFEEKSYDQESKKKEWVCKNIHHLLKICKTDHIIIKDEKFNNGGKIENEKYIRTNQ